MEFSKTTTKETNNFILLDKLINSKQKRTRIEKTKQRAMVVALGGVFTGIKTPEIAL